VALATMLLLSGGLFCAGIQAQQFEVASIKPDKSDIPPMFGVGNGGASERNVTLKTLIGLAWRVQEFEIFGGPAWIGSDRFDVEAKAADPKADPNQLRLMLRSLLEDRFQLTLHRETRESAVYALTIGRGGPTIKLSHDQSADVVNGPAAPGAGPNHGAIRIGAGSLVGNAVTMALFTRTLSQRLDRVVIDRTNLSGRFDIRLQWTPGPGEVRYDPGGNLLPPVTYLSGPSIFSAIQEQLGFKLESAKAPVEVLIIDRAERPSAN
jgi:uncharacterized protein (TIGR03435 family)